ncbi:MAG: DNA primase large subunit PriL [Candidatus Methanosuratus sp.]|nr:DNA primase large subunit PriL [Candidatus Methanosuratincola sp.]
MSLMLTKEDLAKYPFLKESATFVESLQLDLSDLATEEYSCVLMKALARIRNGIDRTAKPVDLSDPETEILAYPLSLAFVYGSKSNWLLNRFATVEAKRVEEELRREPEGKLVEIAELGFAWDIQQENLKLEWEELSFSMPVHAYLEAATGFNDTHWKLINRYVKGGRVFLNSGSLSRLISEGFKMKIIRRGAERELADFRLPEALRRHLDEIMKYAQRNAQYDEKLPQGLVSDARPPCIVAIMEDVKAGKSLSHMARFALTTFMVNVGEGVDEVLKLFGNVADFDEGKARYQIEHIAGMIGSKTKYKPPKCDVLRSFGLCVGMNESCRNAKHPLNYYRRELKRMSRFGGQVDARGRKKRV